MTIIQKDRNTYEAFQEEAIRKLRECHPNDESKHQKIVEAHLAVTKALETLDRTLRGTI